MVVVTVELTDDPWIISQFRREDVKSCIFIGSVP